MGGMDSVMKFKNDDDFSRICDRSLGWLWEKMSHDGRYVFTGSEFFQKKLGIDIVCQGKDNNREITIDTKNVRGVYDNFYLEEMSCPEFNKPGWLLKENGHPDFIFYAFWNEYGFQKGYLIDFQELRNWFINNRERYYLHQNTNTINKTTGRIVPINDVIDAIGSKVIYEF